ncbi:HupE/UreJ family protein [Cryomorphaceae bacterium 1068]|nr:HupE/UreJ family protein [Cryomorphaceae bacterium 1068]
MFSTYFELGVRHIADINAYDHMVFLLALIAVYQLIDLKKIVLLVTAFTIGHSITLVLATLDLINVESKYIEFLIPITILITAITNLIQGRSAGKGAMGWKYFLATFFGLIHGMGFSNYLQAILSKQQDLFIPMLGFNLGVELGQLIIVLVILIIGTLSFQVFRFKHRDWILVISGACAGAALILAKDTVFW